MPRKFIFFMLLSWLNCSEAAQDNYVFTQPEQQQRFMNLTQQLRCLVCQNQTLADSNSPLAQDLRAEVAKMIKADMVDENIIAYLTKRYGEFILYKPAFSKTTWLLWLGPLLLLMGGFIAIAIIINKRRKLQE